MRGRFARLGVFVPLIVMIGGLATAALIGWQTLRGMEAMVVQQARAAASEDGRFLARETAALLRLGEVDDLRRVFATAAFHLRLDRVALIDEAGRVRYSNTPSDVGKAWQEVDWLRSGPAEAIRRDRASHQERIGDDFFGVNVLLTRRDPDDLMPAITSVLVSASDMRPLLAASRREAWRMAALQAATTIALSGFLTWVLQRRLSRRAAALIRATERLGSDDFESTDLPGGHDELGGLANSLQAMNGQLRAAIVRFREDERRLQSVMDQSTQLIVLCSPDGVVRHANQAFMDATGVDRREAAGESLPEVLASTFEGPASHWYVGVIQRLGGRRGSRGFRLDSEAGGRGRRYFLASMTSVFDERGECESLVFEARDVTERERLYERLRVRESTLAEAMAQARLGTWELNSGDGVVRLSKEAVAVFDGAVPDRLSLRDVIREIQPADRVRVVRWMRSLVLGVPQTVHRVQLHRRPTGRGHRIEVDLRGTARPGGNVEETVIHGFVQDVTEQARAERGERDMNQLLESVTSRIPGAIYRRTRDEDGEIRYPFMRGQLWARLGLTQEEATPEHLLGFVHEIDRQRVEEFLVLEPSGTERLEFRIVDPKDRVQWMAAHIDHHLDTNGQSVSDGIIIDITEEKHAELWMARSRKMEAVAQLAGGVAHDFNNILAVVKGYAEFLESDVEAGESVDPAQVQSILRAVHRGERVTRRLLDMSRDEPGVVRTIDACQHLQEFKKTIGAIVTPGLDVEVELDCPSAPISVEEEELHNTLLNLVVNARDACAGRGRIRLLAEIRSDVLPSMSGRRAVPTVCISVEDNGAGMDEDTMERALEPFFTTKPAGKGTGLGLPSAYNFAHRHDGELRLESEPGKGTRATLCFPLSMQAVDSTPDVVRRIVPGCRRAERVLVVEDEDDLRPLLEQTLTARGLKVLVARDGAEARRLLHHEEVDLLITDLMLPGRIGGRQLIDEMQGRRPNMPVIVISGYSSEMEKLNADERVILLRKPFALSELGDAVERAGNHVPGPGGSAA